MTARLAWLVPLLFLPLAGLPLHAGQGGAQPATAVASPPLAIAPFDADGIYDVGARAGWTVSIPTGTTAPSAPFTYTIRKNNSDVVATGTLDFSDGRASIETAMSEPAMLRAVIEGGGLKAPIALGAAVAPTELRPAVPRPRDFDAFWDSKLAALRKVPIEPRLTELRTTVPGVRLFQVTLDSLGSKVRGYLAMPDRGGPFPALMLYQWAGVYALQTRTVTDRAAEGWLAFNVSSHDMPPDQTTGVPRDYQTIGNRDRETSYFLHMYLRDVRAVDYITTRPDWNGRTIAVTGTSMGGQQSLATAALHRKVTAVIANLPSGADSNGDLHGRRAGYPNWPSQDPQVMQTALYFDTVNLASRITAPTIVAMGFLDTIAPPVGIWTALNQVRGPREAVPMIDSDHDNITPDKLGPWQRRSREALEEVRRTGRLRVRPAE